MRIVTFASGSTGNCGLISDGKANILIDAGISMRRTVSALGNLGLTPHDLCGVLITHEHSDHISGLGMLVKHYGIKIFAPEALSRVLAQQNPKLADNLVSIPMDESFDLDGISVRCFRTPHDASFSVGYRFEGSHIAAYATDTGSLTPELLGGLCGAELVLIESNHDTKMLENGPYPYFLKRRIRSSLGHLSNSDSAKLASELEKSGARYIILGHLSRENNTPSLAFDTVKSALCDEKTELFVAPMNELLAITLEDAVECLI